MIETVFKPEIKKQAEAIMARYETKRASILEILRLVQESCGYVSTEAEEAVAELLEIPAIDVHEVVTFYTLFYRKPKCKTRLNVCRTLTCALAGGDRILDHLEKKHGLRPGEAREDGSVSLQTVECLGACEIAPMMQLNDSEYIGPLTPEKIDQVLERK